MNRALLAGMVSTWLLPLDAIAQNFQFQSTSGRARSSLMSIGPLRGYAAGGDLDSNGRGDLVVTSSWFSSVVMLAAGTGFGSAGSLPFVSGAEALRPVLVDLDGDGDLDVACVPPRLPVEGAVVLYENVPGSMTRVALPNVMRGVPLQGVAVGRLDGDAVADLVVATPARLGLPSLVLVRGAPGLQYAIDLTAMPAGVPAGLYPVLIDANADGNLDVLATNPTSGLCLLINVGGGTFVDLTATLPPRTGHLFLAVADLDGDGRDDCAAPLANGDVDVLWGAQAGLTLAAAVVNVPSAGLSTLWPADFDGDGDLDLLAEHGSGLDVLWNQGNRQFARTDLVREPTSMRGVVDADGDGSSDVVFATVAADQVARCKYGARFEDTAFATGIAPFPAANTSLSAVGDVDGDGHPDIVTPQWDTILVDHAEVGYSYRRTISPLAVAAPGVLWRTELADMDGDGDLDLVIKDDTLVSIAANDGTGTFAWMHQVGAVSAARDDLRLGDVDGDGDLDVMTCDTPGNVLIRNLGGGQFAAPVVVAPATFGPHALELADVDGDGDLDLVTVIHAGAVGGAMRGIAANDGTGLFTPNAFVARLGYIASCVRAADVDADGDADLLVNDLPPRLLRNNGAGWFTDTTAADLALPPGQLLPASNLVVADLDDDGDVDLAAMSYSSSVDAPPATLLLMVNDGSGRFTDVTTPRCGPTGLVTPASALLRGADVDDDGDVDLVLGSGRSAVVMWNHVRQLRSNAVPRLGGLADLHLMSGPNFGQPGLGLLGVGFALAAPPLQLPGLAGQLELDLATMQVATAVTTSSIGVSSVFVAVPQDAVLFGLQVWFQGAILPNVGQPGFTNVVHELVLR